MNKLILISAIFLFSVINIFSQKNNYNWCFGKYNNITFNTVDLKPEIVGKSAIDTREGCASTSDIDGNLLFYSDGITVFTKEHKPMVNGKGLKGSTSATQSALIVPQPGNSDLFYVFTVNSNENRPIKCYYSIVDMSKQSGLGEVIIKNILLSDSVTERLTAVQHRNGNDFWVLIHKSGKNEFMAYFINKEGLDTIPVLSAAGLNDNLKNESVIGYLKASPNGEKLAQADYSNDNHFELFDFNRSTGLVSNPIDLGYFKYAYGVEFSPDGTKLFCTEALGMKDLVQFDISSGDSDIIRNSIHKIPLKDNIKGAGLQLAPDNKIYMAQLGRTMLSVINKPNETGDDCNFVLNGFQLTDTCYCGLPNNFKRYCPEYYLDVPDSILACFGEQLQIGVKPDSGFSYSWFCSTGEILPDNSMIKIITDTNKTYTLLAKRVKSDCDYSSQITICVYPRQEINLNAPDYLCFGESEFMEIQGKFKEIQWSDGQTGNKISISKPGIYTVECIDSNGCTYSAQKSVTSVNLTTLPQVKVDFGLICSYKSISYSTILPHPNNFDLFIDSVYYKSNNQIEVFDKDSLIGIYSSNAFKGLSFKFIAKKEGEIHDTIFIHITYPCDYTYKVPISGNVTSGDISIWTNDTTAAPTNNFKIPIHYKFSCNETIKADYTLKFKINKQVFHPEKVETGEITGLSDVDGFYIIEIKDTNKLIIKDSAVINNLYGVINIGSINHSDIEILDFYAEGINPSYKNGSLTVQYCADDLRQIILSEPINFIVTPNPAKDELIISSNSKLEGLRLRIYDLLGNVVFQEIYRGKSLNIYQLQPGAYICEISDKKVLLKVIR